MRPKPQIKAEPFDALRVARRVIEIETEGLHALSAALGDQFNSAVERLVAITGRIILTGIGKSGHVGRKVASTLASTGTPAYFVHPSEASHGDMGMIGSDDAVIALSRSGESKELADLIAYTQRFDVPLIAMTMIQDSALGRSADEVLLLPMADEACGETGAPTTSTTLQLVLGDALAIALLERRGFTAAEFRTFHPGGALGAALTRIGDLMHQGSKLPLVSSDSLMGNALIVMSEKGFGCVGVTDRDHGLIGIVTDGDLRRHMGETLVEKSVMEVMTESPRTVTSDALAADVLRMMTADSPKISQVFVLEDAKPIGIVHLHDLLRTGVA